MKGKWEKAMLPVIKNLPTSDFTSDFMKDLMSVQPMQFDGPPSYMEEIDISNPRVGVVINDKDKHPEKPAGPLCGCCREYWSKIWTPRRGWVYERTDPKGFRRMYKKYHAKYKAMIERERKAWNKKYGIKNRIAFNMIILHDSKKKT